MSKLVALRAGHGGRDPGAVGNGIREKDINLSLALSLEKHLNDNYICNVLQIRKTDIFVGLGTGVQQANNAKADCFISIHCNAFSNPAAWGYEDFVWNGALPQSTRSLRDSIHKYVSPIWTRTGSPNRGKKVGNYYELRTTAMDAVLLEHGFITNAHDSSFQKRRDFLQQLSEATAVGIADALKLERKQTPQQSEDAPSLVVYRVVAGSYANRRNALNQVVRLKQNGLDSFIDAFHNGDVTMFRVIAGSFSNRANAVIAVNKLRSLRFQAFLAAHTLM